MLRRYVLIFHAGALGDFVLTWPIALAAARLWPQSRVVYVTPASKGQLAQRCLQLEHSDVESGWHHLHADPGQLPELNRKLIQQAHTVISFVSEPDDVFSSNLRRLAGDNLRLLCLRAPDASSQEHATLQYVAQLRSFAALQEAARQMLRLLQTRGIVLPRITPTRVMLHPGSGSPSKNWPLDRYLSLANRLRETAHRVAIVIGEVERERVPEADLDRLREHHEVLCPLTPCELLDTLRNADSFIGNDSGPGHLAALLGAHVVSLFGPTNPAVWAPVGPNVQVLRAPSLLEIDVERVLASFLHRPPT